MADNLAGRGDLTEYQKNKLEDMINMAGVVPILDYLHEKVWREYVRDRKRWDLKELYECLIRGKHAYMMKEDKVLFEKTYVDRSF